MLSDNTEMHVYLCNAYVCAWALIPFCFCSPVQTGGSLIHSCHLAFTKATWSQANQINPLLASSLSPHGVQEFLIFLKLHPTPLKKQTCIMTQAGQSPHVPHYIYHHLDSVCLENTERLTVPCDAAYVILAHSVEERADCSSILMRTH